MIDERLKQPFEDGEMMSDEQLTVIRQMAINSELAWSTPTGVALGELLAEVDRLRAKQDSLQVENDLLRAGMVRLEDKVALTRSAYFDAQEQLATYRMWVPATETTEELVVGRKYWVLIDGRPQSANWEGEGVWSTTWWRGLFDAAVLTHIIRAPLPDAQEN